MSKSDDKQTLTQAKEYAEKISRFLRRAKVGADIKTTVSAQVKLVQKATSEKNPEDARVQLERLRELVKLHLDYKEKSAFQEYFESIGVAVLIALALRGFIFEAFKIPTGSMIPTLLVGDHIFVNKFIYGVRVPFTETYLVNFKAPERGEIVVFTFPMASARAYLAEKTFDRECIDRDSLENEKEFIKRIIAVEGDTVEIRDGVLRVNGTPLPRTVVEEARTGRYMAPVEVREVESNGPHEYTIQYRSRDRDFGPVKIKEGHVFAMGDHRDNSADSRCWGQVPVENIKGRAILIWMSWGDDGIRWERIGHMLD
ncbi:MAG: signal peptidase I [bacterium]